MTVINPIYSPGAIEPEPETLKLVERFTAAMRPRVAASTLRLRLYWINKLIHADSDILSITTEGLNEFIWSNEAWSANTRQTLVSSMKLFYGWLFDSGRIVSNPASRIMRVRVPKRTARMASESAIAEGLEGASASEAAIILLGAECGLRLAEIASLRLENRNGNWITVIGKGSVERSLYLSPELAAILDRLEETKVRWGWYFPGRASGHLAPSTIWKVVTRLVGVNTHALRHRAGTTAYRNTNFDIRLAQEFLGHSSPATTAGYVHVERERLIDAAAATRIGAKVA